MSTAGKWRVSHAIAVRRAPLLSLGALLAIVVVCGCEAKPSAKTNSPESFAAAGADAHQQATQPVDESAPRRLVRVAAASDLQFALKEVAAHFEAAQADCQISITFGSSGNLFAQLSNKAPFDIFLSADMSYPRRLVEAGLAAADSEFLYGIGRIVVWVPAASPLDLEKLGLRAVVDPAVKKIAIANPQHAPYGRAAEAALKQLGVYDEAKERLVLGENISQAAQFVESGAADVGILALSLALAPAMKDKGRYWLVPVDAYPRMEQGGVIMNDAQDRAAAQEFCDFLKSDPARAILREYGFEIPGA